MGEKTLDRYAYFGDATVPEIPYVQDVLYVFHLSDKDERYEFGLEHHPPYVCNVIMTAARVAERLFRIDEREEAARQKLIAEEIIKLCPEEARCLFNPAYSDALYAAGKRPPNNGADQLWLRCGCRHCRSRQVEANRLNACDD